jgi:signal transduction histidine kinase
MSKRNQSFPWKFTIATILLSFAYAVIRYHFFGITPLKDIPLYVGNKVLAVSSVISFTAFLYNKKNYFFGGLSYLLLLGHLIISFLILNSAYFKKFFINTLEFNDKANLSLFFGVLAFLGIWVYHQIKKGNKLFSVFSKTTLTYLILLGISLHLIFMGYSDWLHPVTWKGYLPPISLIGFIVLLFGFFRKI